MIMSKMRTKMVILNLLLKCSFITWNNFFKFWKSTYLGTKSQLLGEKIQKYVTLNDIWFLGSDD